jgi:hypothetical protein
MFCLQPCSIISIKKSLPAPNCGLVRVYAYRNFCLVKIKETKEVSMRKIRFAVVAASIVALTLAGSAWAQQGMGPGAGYGRMYNPQTVETVSGQVVSVDTMSRGRYQGVHLTVKSDKETIAVHLGPSWYLNQQKMTFSPKDTLEITGSRVTFDGKPTIIAAEVKKGGQSLKLRDASGIPMWAGQGRRQ